MRRRNEIQWGLSRTPFAVDSLLKNAQNVAQQNEEIHIGKIQINARKQTKFENFKQNE